MEKLKNYIEAVDIRNTDEKVTRLLGVSIEKKFMESIANTIGTDMRTYKIVKKGQFAYGPVTSRNGDKVSIAFLEEDECIISSSYSVFQVIDENILLPEYLMLWFRRPEFDRYARFHSHGSAREIFDWEEMGNVELPIPTIEEQKAIIQSYNDIQKRIEVKRKINDNLESQAQAIYRANFIDFEPYDGIMPSTWQKSKIGNVVSIVRGASPRPIQDYMSDTGIPWVKIFDASASPSKYLFETAEFIADRGVKHSRVITPGTMIVSNSASPGLPMISNITACVHDGWLIIDDYDGVTQEYLYYHFLAERQNLVASSNGSVFNNLKTDIVKEHPIIIPDLQTLSKYTAVFKRINSEIYRNARELRELLSLSKTILSCLSR